MTDAPEDIDFDAVWERALVDPVYMAFIKAQLAGEWEQAVPLTCGDCGTVLLRDEWDNEYCPECGE